MSTKRLLFTSSLINAFGHFTLLVASFFSLPILISALKSELFGKYLLMVGIPALAGLFDLGFGNGSLYYLSRDPSHATWRRTLGNNIVTTIPMLIASYVIGYIVVGPSLAYLITILVLVNQVSDVFLMLAQARNNYQIFNLKVVLVGLGNTIISAIVASFTHSLGAILSTQIIIQLFVMLIIALWVISQNFTLRPIFELKFARLVFRYGLTTFGSTVAGQLQAQAARYYLTYALGAGTTGIFGLAQSLVQKGLTLIQVTGRSFFATSANLTSQKRYQTISLMFKASIVIILSLGVLAVIFTHYFGYTILNWWLSDVGLASQVFPVLVVLSYWFVSVSLTPLASYIGLGIGEGKTVSLFAISSMIVELGLMVILTSRYGILGPAYSALISSIIHTPIFLYILWRKISAKA